MHSSSPPETTSGSAGFHWRSPAALLMVMGAAMQLSFAVWWVLVKNFTVDEAGFTGKEIGMLESIREIPGFLAFLVVFILLLMREQTLAFVSLIFLGVGVALTGYFPNALGLFITTFIMSVGFHFYETAAQSLQLQWLPKKEAPAIMGKIIAVAAAAQLFAYGVIFLTWQTFNLSFEIVFLIAGLMTVAVTIGLWMAYPQYKIGVPQRRKIILRKRYWLYYALTFMSGARRQIFTVFAGFLMVEKFGFEVQHIAALFLINGVVNVFLAPAIGRFIMHWGERRALTLEYIGLIGVFVAYAFVNDPVVAGVLYVLDHAFFAMAIAMRTYFQKIADPADMAPTAGVAFTINHIAAVFIPVIFGFVWLVSPAAVFLTGAAMAAVSLVLARCVPFVPEEGREFIWVERARFHPAE